MLFEPNVPKINKTMATAGKKRELNGRQKAAIFLVTLGPDVASEIFKHLREDEIEALTFEMARLDKVTPEDKETVLMEFNEMMMAQEFITSGGIDYARDVLERALGTQKAIDIINRLTSSLQVRPFDFIRRTDPQHLRELQFALWLPATSSELYSKRASANHRSYSLLS